MQLRAWRGTAKVRITRPAPCDFGVPAAFGSVVAERGGVGGLGLEGGDEFGVVTKLSHCSQMLA